MKTTLLATLFLFLTSALFAQNYAIGTTTVTFNDPLRTGGFGSGGGAGRQIQSEIYYPATTAGDGVALANGDFPVVVFGHGFVMSWDAYQNIWEELVPLGYIVVFPRTEGGFSPSHDEFALDLALLVTKMQDLNSNTGSLFNTHVAPKSAIMGHSMGGGASFLAAASNTSIETVIGLAPAETTPSAIAAATQVSVPSLILSGSGDAVTPPLDHHIPIYNALGSTCKYFVDITGGGHCYFANTNFNCDFGEASSGGTISISRAEQQQISASIYIPWLEFKLKGSCAGGSAFNQFLDSDPRIVATKECTGAAAPINTNVTINVSTLSAENTTATYQWLDCDNAFAAINGETNISFIPSVPGNYAVQLTENGCVDTSACYYIPTLGLETPFSFPYHLGPNPSSGTINISVLSEADFRLYDLNGKLLSDHHLVIGENELHLTESDGIYMYVIHSQGESAMGRLILK